MASRIVVLPAPLRPPNRIMGRLEERLRSILLRPRKTPKFVSTRLVRITDPATPLLQLPQLPQPGSRLHHATLPRTHWRFADGSRPVDSCRGQLSQHRGALPPAQP